MKHGMPDSAPLRIPPSPSTPRTERYKARLDYLLSEVNTGTISPNRPPTTAVFTTSILQHNLESSADYLARTPSHPASRDETVPHEVSKKGSAKGSSAASALTLGLFSELQQKCEGIKVNTGCRDGITAIVFVLPP